MYGRSLRVLIIDDDGIQAQVAQKVVAALGQESTTAAFGDGAYELLTTIPFDLILIDLDLEKSESFATVAQLRRMSGHARTPVIALAQDMSPVFYAQCLAAGMNDALARPLRTQQLKKAFGTFLSTHAEPSVAPTSIENPNEILNEHILLGLRAVDDNEGEFVDELIDLFVTLTPPVITRLLQALKDGKEPLSISLAHKIKGMCRNLGILTLASTMETIEMSYASLSDEVKLSLPEKIQSEFDQAVNCLKTHWYRNKSSA